MYIRKNRFLTSHRRLHKLKLSTTTTRPDNMRIVDVKIDTEEGQKKDKEKLKKKGAASTKDKQDKDDVTIEQVQSCPPEI